MKTINQLNMEIIKSNNIPEIDFYDSNKDLLGEEWAEIEFVDNKYKISNYGRLKSYALNEDGIILRNRITNHYASVILSVSKKRKTIYIHKLVAQYFVQKEDDTKNLVMHIDSDRKNNYFKNLKWGDAKECFDKTDRLNKEFHRKFRLSASTSAKITSKDADRIRAMIALGMTQIAIAKKFNLSAMQITRIKRNENWKPKVKRPRILKMDKQKILIKK